MRAEGLEEDFGNKFGWEKLDRHLADKLLSSNVREQPSRVSFFIHFTFEFGSSPKRQEVGKVGRRRRAVRECSDRARPSQLRA